MLKGLKVLEFEGLAPSVFLGMYFADQGAEVTLIARPQPAPFSLQINKNVMNRNKLCIKLSLKDKNDRMIITEMIKKADVIIDPYRPGVLEKQKFGPQDLYKINPKIILLRVTGYGQQGSMSMKPGHDLNYIGSSGILNLINKKNPQKLQFPSNFLADFVSASLGINGTLNALQMAKKKGQGCVVDCSLTDGCAYLTQLASQQSKITHQNSRSVKIHYFQIGQKRYVITSKESQKFDSKEINQAVHQMNLKNQEYFRNKKYQIAEIKKIKGIKETNLKNPFDRKQNTQLLNNLIPSRDQNRREILTSFNITLNPKL